MTLGTLLLMLVTIQLVLVAYGVISVRRRLAGRARLLAEALLIALPPLLIAGLLLVTGEGELVATWWRLFALMILAGAGVAFVAEQVARRVDP